MDILQKLLLKKSLLSRFIRSNVQNNVCRKFQRIISPYELSKYCVATSYNSQILAIRKRMYIRLFFFNEKVVFIKKNFITSNDSYIMACSTSDTISNCTRGTISIIEMRKYTRSFHVTKL